MSASPYASMWSHMVPCGSFGTEHVVPCVPMWYHAFRVAPCGPIHAVPRMCSHVLSLCSHVFPCGHIWCKVVTCVPMRSHVVPCGPTHVLPCVPMWLHVVTCGATRPQLVPMHPRGSSMMHLREWATTTGVCTAPAGLQVGPRRVLHILSDTYPVRVSRAQLSQACAPHCCDSRPCEVTPGERVLVTQPDFT